ncbi:MAG: cysteine desulfurase family protein [Rhodothermales bacterium]
MSRPIYLDYNATTPVDPAVLDAMLPYFTEQFGNPSSAHAYGWAADEAVKQAREQLGALLGARPDALTFTSGATEAANLAIRGTAAAYRGKKDHVVTVATEHKAVLDPVRSLEAEGYRVTVLGVQPDGRIDLDVLRDALTDTTLLVAVMWANNETGVIQPVPEIAEIVRERGALFMTDATQAVGKIPVDVAHADLLICSGHKVYGPKGVGALYRSRRQPRVRLEPEITGGGQEDGLRSGTLNVPGIVGLGKAAEVAGARLDEDAARLAALRDRLEAALLDRIDGVRVNGSTEHRLPNTANLVFPGTHGKLLPAIRGVAASVGSSCRTKSARPSHVLTALGLSDDDAFDTLRLSLGRFTTEDEIGRAADEIVTAVARLRAEPIPA